MQIGYIGLGKMGKNMVLRLLEKKHKVIAWNRSPAPREEVAAAGAQTVVAPQELIEKMQGQRIIWLMLPAGEITGKMIDIIVPLLSKGDILIDGANSKYTDTLERVNSIEARGIHFLDVGVSGGPHGARTGACCMIGGNNKTIFDQLEPLFADISAPGAYRYLGPAGAGHYVKMVHNGIEYGMMQAIGEGFEIMRSSPFNLNLEQVADIYNARSVIESRLIGWLASGYRKNGIALENISGSVKHSGEGQWTVEEARRLGVPSPVIEAAFDFRLASSNNPSYTGKVVSTLRSEFGGHAVAAELT